MSEIKKGDLVMVVKPTPCCGNTDRVGLTFTVREVGRAKRPYCFYCGVLSDELAAAGGIDAVYRLSRLKKIDPPAEGETREAYKNLKVPA